MGSGCDYKCEKCGYKFTTSSSWEFYRDAKGKIQCYGHPGPLSVEALKSGIYGFMDTKYCLNCRKLVDILLVEFDKPADYHAAWGYGLLGGEYQPVICPYCNKTDFLEDEDIISKKFILCPKCNKGKLLLESSWIS